MVTHYSLEVLRAEGVIWGSGHLSKAPSLYVRLRLGDEEKQTRVVKRQLSPEWNEFFTFVVPDSSQATDLVIKLNHKSSLLSKSCIGTANIKAEALLGSNEARVEVHALPSRGATSEMTGHIYLRLKIVNEKQVAETEMKSASSDAGRLASANPAVAQGLSTVEEVTSRVNDQKDLIQSLGSLLGKIQVFKDIADKIAAIHPYANAAWQVITFLYEAVQQQIEADQKVVTLVGLMEDIFDYVNHVDSLRDKVKPLQSKIIEILRQTTECCLYIRQYARPGFIGRMIDLGGQKQKVDEFLTRFNDLRDALVRGTTLQTTFVAAREFEIVNVMRLRDELAPAAMDASDRPECLPGTRTEYLDQIMGWLFSETQHNMFWLRGVAGSGKSTISMTIAEMCLSMRRRGAYLFFTRNKSDPASVIRTIAFWLASFDHTIAKHVGEAVELNNGIAYASLDSQFEKLLLGPLQAAASSMQGPVAIILDALDECGSPAARSKLLKIIKQDFPRLPSAFRFLITGRPEKDLAEALAQPCVYEITLQHSSEESRADVSRYIEHEMHVIFEKEDMEISADWSENMALLSRTADGLFVWASTAVKQVTLSDFPFVTLEQLISYCQSRGTEDSTGTQFDLSDLYESVLSSSGIRWEDKDSREIFSRILGIILLGKAPLSVAAIDGLLGLPPAKSSRYHISRLQSVLAYTPGDINAPVRLFHTSFFDYLTAPERVGQPWCVDGSFQRLILAGRCLDVLHVKLRFNICNLESSFARNDDVNGVDNTIKNSISSDLIYACRFWAEHLCDIPPSSKAVDLMGKLEKFAYRRLLYWLEVLSLTKYFHRSASRALFDAALWTANSSRQLSSFLWDAYRLTNIFSLPISQSVPHIYLSALSLSKGESLVAEHYSHHHPVVTVRRFGIKPPVSCMKGFKGHTAQVYSIVFSPDGKRMASASTDMTVRVWDAESGELVVGPLKGHDQPVYCAAFSPDGKRIVSGSGDGRIHVWDAERGDIILGPIQGHKQKYRVTSVAFSPDCKRIVSSSDDGTIRIWDAMSGELLVGTFEGRYGSVHSVAFSPDGTCIVSGSSDNTVRIWDAMSGELIRDPFRGHDDTVRSIAFSRDGTRIVSGAEDGTIRVWNASNGELIGSPIVESDRFICAIALSPDGKRIAAACRAVRVWDAETGELLSGPFEARDEGLATAVAFSPDGKRLASGAENGIVYIWDAESGDTVVGPLKGHDLLSIFTISADGRRIASSTFEGIVHVWDMKVGELIAGPLKDPDGGILSIALSPNEKLIATVTWNQTVRIWDISSGELICGPFGGNIHAVFFSPDCTRLASISPDVTLRLWDTASGEPITETLEGHSDATFSIAFSPDGGRIASGSKDTTVRIWNAESGESIAGPFVGHEDAVDSVSFSPDGNLVASGSRDCAIRVWNAESGDLIIGPLKGHTKLVTSLAFSLSGRRIASGSEDMTICIWDVESGALVAGPFKGPPHSVQSVLFSLDGRYLISGSTDGTSCVWDIEYAEIGSSLVAAYATNNEPSTSSLAEIRNISQSKNINYDKISFLARLGISANWRETDDGWLVGKNGELLLWVPPEIRPTLWQPSNTSVSNLRFSTELDLTGCSLGGGWYSGHQGLR